MCHIFFNFLTCYVRFCFDTYHMILTLKKLSILKHLHGLNLLALAMHELKMKISDFLKIFFWLLMLLYMRHIDFENYWLVLDVGSYISGNNLTQLQLTHDYNLFSLVVILNCVLTFLQLSWSFLRNNQTKNALQKKNE